MQRSDSIANLATGLAAAQAAIRGAAKDKANPFFKSKYADLASIWEACRGPLTANGLSVVQLPTMTDAQVSVETMLLHKSGEFLSAVLTAPLKEHTPQAIGSVITYLRRYSLAAMAGVAPDEDDDAEGAMGRNGHKQEAQTAPIPEKQTAARVAPQTDADSEALCEEHRQAIGQAKDEDSIKKIGAAILAEHKAHRINDTQRNALKKLADVRRLDLGIVGNGATP